MVVRESALFQKRVVQFALTKFARVDSSLASASSSTSVHFYCLYHSVRSVIL